MVYRLTRELDYRYNAPVIVPGGIPVDLDAAGARQHEAAMGTAEPAAPVWFRFCPQLRRRRLCLLTTHTLTLPRISYDSRFLRYDGELVFAFGVIVVYVISALF